ncbi:hypothetical protein Asppvi_005885 [Aspergillus pseudoviridinutans]|uniref:Uncharacterized protein n=1 Tax=Aspergillus pseudoviridinutans TaxID=1517512 RepID=A0A9P3B932_9EURO|nr:uncharacterized protein Asppvi_005885 [Aspergillus pseudoviridinutans]GIJ86986.1 hypothetical protein Asppvi_005885 [Aspergillus pseudoviridinutans]
MSLQAPGILPTVDELNFLERCKTDSDAARPGESHGKTTFDALREGTPVSMTAQFQRTSGMAAMKFTVQRFGGEMQTHVRKPRWSIQELFHPF